MSDIVEIQAADPLMSDVYALRRRVFVVEQGIPEDMEIDEHDQDAVHLAAVSNGQVIGTLRIVLYGRTAKIGRMAVSASSRRRGLGRELMEFAAATALRRGVEEIVLSAQLSAREFYHRMGYSEEGPTFDEVGLMHVLMRKNMSR
ncbi:MULTISPECIES: GNAT family N-acetyltransferase [unclassified Bradyrhizobium]|uniref:GNAT family N-acetyltransferase n=1 Tax=unclassified Bradyrhizobium TaxID=2631580 RepID=UPI0024E08975|nr:MULTISPECIES: GNAT family N-acetyltransferase [unclassified Bradyrhizobium]